MLKIFFIIIFILGVTLFVSAIGSTSYGLYTKPIKKLVHYKYKETMIIGNDTIVTFVDSAVMR